LSPSQLSIFFSHIPPPPRSTLFPYTTLFRSTSASKLGSELQESSSCNPRRYEFSGPTDLLQSSTKDSSAGWCHDTPNVQQGRTLPRCEGPQTDSGRSSAGMGSRNQIQTGGVEQAC